MESSLTSPCCPKTHAIPFQTAADLCKAGRSPAPPFDVRLENGQILRMVRLLRVLPGKRITGVGWLGNQRVLAKLFLSVASQRHWTLENAGLRALRNAGLPTPKLVTAQPLSDGGHALLTEFLDPAEPLELIASSAGVLQAVELLGRLHAAGLAHNDLHPGNFLRHREQLYVIDGAAVAPVSTGRPIPSRQALQNLAILLSQIPGDLDSLLVAYRQTNPSLRIRPNRLRRAIDDARRDRTEKLLKKSVRDCSQFAVQRTFRRFTVVVRNQQPALAPLLADPDHFIATGKRMKTGGSSTVVCVEMAHRHVVIKRYNLKNAGHAFSRLWRPSRAWRSWREGLRMQTVGIATPTPLALIEERLGPLRRRAWLITDFCSGTPLSTHLDPEREPSADEATEIVSLFNTLRREKITHGDLKATNLLWHKNRLVVIDLDATKCHRFIGLCRRDWQKDRARFLRNWPVGCALHRWLELNLPR